MLRPETIEFWELTGRDFPSLKQAASTGLYRRGEIDLLTELAGPLEGSSVFKTDLWDEAKNSEILVWIADQEAKVYGIDLSFSTAAQAQKAFPGPPPPFAVGDLRSLPFIDQSFDLVYSMGTIEHSPDYCLSLAEVYRVLRPGGKALVGTPNKLDPFLRPLLVWILRVLGLYSYGYEKSFTPVQLERVLRRTGFRVVARGGLLFIPGWLRMAELWLFTRRSRLYRLAAAAGRPFAWLHRRFPALRKHGYLIALLAEKPEHGPAP